MKTAIVCEGGGMRGSYTAGVLQSFMEAGFVADELVGVSAGASNGVSYVSGQMGRGYRTNVDYAGDKQYCSVGNFVRTGSIFGMDYVFGEIPEKLDPFDYDAFYASPCQFFAGATDVNTGQPVFFSKEEVTAPDIKVIRASCSMPVLAPIVEYKGGKYLDGGVSAPIPIEKALQDGCEKLVVILTRPRGYTKAPQGGRPIYKYLYRHYPNMIKAIEVRHLVYNHTLERLARLEEQGKAIVIAPAQALEVDRLGKDRDKLIQAYEYGHADGMQALTLL